MRKQEHPFFDCCKIFLRQSTFSEIENSSPLVGYEPTTSRLHGQCSNRWTTWMKPIPTHDLDTDYVINVMRSIIQCRWKSFAFPNLKLVFIIHIFAHTNDINLLVMFDACCHILFMHLIYIIYTFTKYINISYVWKDMNTFLGKLLIYCNKHSCRQNVHKQLLSLNVNA